MIELRWGVSWLAVIVQRAPWVALEGWRASARRDVIPQGPFRPEEAESCNKNDITLRRQENNEPIENNSMEEGTRGTYRSIRLNNSVLMSSASLQTAIETRSELRTTSEMRSQSKKRQGGSKRAALAVRRSDVNAGRGGVQWAASLRANRRSSKLGRG